MTDPHEPEQASGARDLYMSRLVHEVEILVDMSLALQAGIHTLDLSKSNPQTRKVLQSADTLTQTLMCVKAAMQGVSGGCRNSQETNIADVLRGVFLEDVRARLEHGPLTPEERSNRPEGYVELF